MTDSEKLQLLFDRVQISEAVNRYSVTIDSRGWKGFRAIFTDEIDILLTMAKRADRPRQTVKADDFARVVEQVITSFSVTQHFLTDYRIEIKGDAATCLSYMYARHMPPSDKPSQPIWDLGGYYEFHLRRSGDGWKVPKYTLMVTWETGRPKDLKIDL
jgi:SnoaL-like protein